MDEIQVKIAKLRPNAVIPTKRKEDACFDIYPCFDRNHMTIAPHCTEMIPTGLATSFPEGNALMLKERGSVGSKGIALRCGVVDSGYRGEIFVALTNTTKKFFCIVKNGYDVEDLKGRLGNDIVIYPYEKAIAQAYIECITPSRFEEMQYSDLTNIESDRGAGKLGSSGK